MGPKDVSLLRREDFRVGLAHDLFLANAKHLFELLVNDYVAPLNIFNKDEAWTVIQEGMEAFVAVAQSFLGVFAIGDVLNLGKEE